MSNWKNAERQTAKILGGTRRVRINYSESCEDVHHTVFAIEVKYGKQIPKWVGRVKLPVFVDGVFILFRLSSMSQAHMATEIKRSKGLGFLIKGLEQARSYGNKIPILCMKPPQYRDLIGCMYITDWVLLVLNNSLSAYRCEG